MENTPEIIVLSIRECFVYKIPPLRTASGHRAEDWKLENPLFSGCLKIFQADSKLRIVVYSPKDGKSAIFDENIQIFCESRIEVKPGENILSFVDGVIDSSRYFVIRVQDPSSSRSTMVGVGFRERDVAFDFKNSLNEYVRYVERMDLAARMAAEAEAEQQPSDSTDEKWSQAFAHDDKANLSLTTISSSCLSSAPSVLLQHIKPLEEGVKMKLSLKSLSGRAEEGGQKQTTNPPSILPSSSQPIRIKGPPSTSAAPSNTLSSPPPIQSGPPLTLDEDEDEFGSWECGQ
eukprot:gene24534-32996_t